MLPLANEEMLEALVALSIDTAEDIRKAAASTIETLKPESYAALASEPSTPQDVLAFLCLWSRAPREMVEQVIFNRATPDGALAHLAGRTKDPKIVEAISLKQQSLIRSPEIIESILANPARTPEAERRAREVREEFFEKQFGAEMIAGENRVQAESEAAARAAEEKAKDTVAISGIEDLIRLGLIDEGISDEFVTSYEAEFGPFDETDPGPELDIERVVEQIEAEEGQVTLDRMPVFQQIALMSVKERVMLAIRGTREARIILVRDPNRLVACAVLRNPQVSETEIENIAAIKSVPEDVLRQIGQNRSWTRSYLVIHNLTRNPRTPIAISLGFLNRILTRDLRALSLNKNIPDVIRTAAHRAYLKRSGTGK